MHSSIQSVVVGCPIRNKHIITTQHYRSVTSYTISKPSELWTAISSFFFICK